LTVVDLQTSHDRLAVQLASGHPLLRLVSASAAGLELTGAIDALDAYVVALGQAGVAVRSMSARVRSLESLFLALTANSGLAGSADTTGPGSR
jgi:ABC-2 type transport system ATP-binding protein